MEVLCQPKLVRQQNISGLIQGKPEPALTISFIWRESFKPALKCGDVVNPLKLEDGCTGEVLDSWMLWLPFYFYDLKKPQVNLHEVLWWHYSSFKGVASQNRLATSSMQYFVECFGLMYWLYEVWSRQGCSSTSLCQAEVQVFGLALLSVWSSCFRKTDWPELRPNAPLSSQL